MSWSNRWIGTRTGIKNAIERYSHQLIGNSKVEFDLAKPHLEALLDMNYIGTEGQSDPVLDLDGNGHAYRAPSESESYSNISITLKTIGKLAE